jgi:hypothetical protein
MLFEKPAQFGGDVNQQSGERSPAMGGSTVQCLTFQGSSLASGVYICRLQAGSYLGSHKMMLASAPPTYYIYFQRGTVLVPTGEILIMSTII